MRNLINLHVKYFLSRIMKRYWKFLDVYVKISFFDKISTEDDGICIEGEKLVLNITNEEDYKVSFNDDEEEFIIEQGNVTYYLS